jgi:hypothetical protein
MFRVSLSFLAESAQIAQVAREIPIMLVLHLTVVVSAKANALPDSDGSDTLLDV